MSKKIEQPNREQVPLDTIVSRRNTYRIKIKVERYGPGIIKDIGERWVDVGEDLEEVLGQLPDDREIMDMMRDKSPHAWMLHEKYKKQEEEREKAITHLRDMVLQATKEIIQSQDKINGYPQ
jgi:hypothetical protein